MNTAEKLWRELFAVSESMKLLHADSRRVSVFYQITLSQLKMVRVVFELTRASGAGIALKSVARKLGTTAAASSEMVDVLVRKKILERNQDPDDRRQVRIRLVPELKAHFCRIEENFTDITAEFLKKLSPENQEIFASVVTEFLKFVGTRGGEQENLQP